MSDQGNATGSRSAEKFTPASEFAAFSREDYRQQVLRLQTREKELLADLEECREFIEGYCDVEDGDYGEPRPNRAMRLCNMIDETHGPGGF